MGKLLAICTSPKRGTVKTEVPSAVLTPEWGIVEDAHGGNWHRQDRKSTRLNSSHT